MSRALPLRTGVAIAGCTIAAHYMVASGAVGWHATAQVAQVLGQLTALVVLVLATRGPDRAAALGLRVPRVRFVIAAILIGSTAWFAHGWLNRPIIAWLGAPRRPVPVGDVAVALDFVTLVMIAPVAEELLFRGVLARSLATSWSWPRALVVSALAFAFYHRSPYQLFSPAIDGVLMGYLALRADSVVPAILVHALHNLMVYLHDDAPAELWRWIAIHHDPLIGAAALLTFAGVIVATRGEPTR